MLRDVFAFGLPGIRAVFGQPGVAAPDYLLSQACYRAATPLPTVITHFLPDFTDFLPILRTFLGDFQPSKTTTHETLGTLGVEESTSWVIRWNITRNSTKGVLPVTMVDRFLPTFRTFLGDYTTSMLLFD